MANKLKFDAKQFYKVDMKEVWNSIEAFMKDSPKTYKIKVEIEENE